jgi:hypothetical protein
MKMDEEEQKCAWRVYRGYKMNQYYLLTVLPRMVIKALS